MIGRKNIKVSIEFCTDVRYKKTNRHGTKIIQANACAKGDSKYFKVGEFHISKENEITYIEEKHSCFSSDHFPENLPFFYFLSKEFQEKYPLPELLKLIP